MCLNYLDNVYKKYIDYYAFSHFERLIYYKKIMKKIKNNIILPVARLDQINNNNNKFKYNYGLQVKKNTFQVKNNFAILPNNLVGSIPLPVLIVKLALILVLTTTFVTSFVQYEYVFGALGFDQFT